MSKHHHKHATAAHSQSSGSTTVAQTVVAAGNSGNRAKTVSAEDIRLCAYRKWESAGKPIGDGLQFWLEAEQELAQGK